jgi:SAM-dependent methyltransferase
LNGTAYDRVRYPGKFYPQSSVDRLATLSRLHGLQSASPHSSRVLELGCGDGGNLIPQAMQFPDAQFVGVDLAASAIEAGRVVIEQLGIRNIQLIAADLAEFDPAGQLFDYVVAHGVLSWVPAPVRDRLMQLCGECLTPQGVAYISYATLPGGYVRNVPRDLMRFHTRHIADAQDKAHGAREVIEFVKSALPATSFVRELIDREMAGTEGKDFFLLHDLLADENEPLYFLDFMEAAAEAGLQYLSEAELSEASMSGLPPAVQRQLEQVPSRLEREQYLDFIHLRRFRQTLLCRNGLSLDLNVTPDRLNGIFISSPVQPATAGTDIRAPGDLEFRHPQWGSFRADTPLTKALGLALARSDPRGITFDGVRQAVAQQLEHEVIDDAALIRFLMSLFARDLVALHSTRWNFSTVVSERPCVSALTRWLASINGPVVNGALGTFYLPSEPLRRLVTLLDGTRTLDVLLDDLIAVTPKQDQSSLQQAILQRRLKLLSDNAMLIS